MSNIPNPYNSPQTNELPHDRSSNNQGFLLMTRHSSASNLTDQNRSYGTVRPLPSPSNEEYISFGNQNTNWSDKNRFSPKERGNQRFGCSYVSPQQGYFRNQMFSSPYNRYQSTPRGNFRGTRATFNSPLSSRANRYSRQYDSLKKTPLKEIPIDKFLSTKMVQNPWQEFETLSQLDISNANSTNSSEDS